MPMISALQCTQLLKHCRHHIALGELFADLVKKDNRFEIVTPPRFALTCFVLKVRTYTVTHTLSGCIHLPGSISSRSGLHGLGREEATSGHEGSPGVSDSCADALGEESGRVFSACSSMGAAHEKCMRVQGPQGNETAALVDAVNKSGLAFMITTELSGQTVARFAIGGAQTQQRHVRAAWQLICGTADGLLASAQA